MGFSHWRSTAVKAIIPLSRVITSATGEGYSLYHLTIRNPLSLGFFEFHGAYDEGLGVAGAQRRPNRAAAGARFWWMVNSLFMGEHRLSNQRSFPGQSSIGG